MSNVRRSHACTYVQKVSHDISSYTTLAHFALVKLLASTILLISSSSNSALNGGLHPLYTMPPRSLRPKDTPAASDSNETSPEPKGNKRRAVSSACIPCRKRKSKASTFASNVTWQRSISLTKVKCDGALPSCSTCTAVYRNECSYDADSDHRRKGALKRDIQSLQQQNDALDVIVESLKSLPETEAVMLLQGLRSDVNPGVVAASLRSNVRLPYSFAPQTLEADFAAQQLSPTAARTRFDSASMTSSRVPSVDESVHSSGTLAVERPAVWFKIPQDAEFVDHLLDLYFCWVHPMYQLLSREHFLYDMGHGRTDFCSAILVNAILSIAYHYSDRYLARADPSNSPKAGDYFFAEAKRMLDKSESSCLTTVQALGIMSVREVSLGRDSSAYQYLGRSVRMAVELGLHLSVDSNGLRSSEIEARKITFWGVFNLETYARSSLLSKCVSLHFSQPS